MGMMTTTQILNGLPSSSASSRPWSEIADKYLTKPSEQRKVTLEFVKDFLARKEIEDTPVPDMPSDWLAKMMLRIATIGSVVQGAKKGILLLGCTGNGKTTRIKAVADFFHCGYGLAYEMVADISSVQFRGTIRDICNYPTFGNTSNPRKYDMAIDDVGTESPIVAKYGTPHDYMEEILRERHLALESGALTHIATNLDMAGLRNRYGERIYSRLQEMCVPIVMPNVDRRSSS